MSKNVWLSWLADKEFDTNPVEIGQPLSENGLNVIGNPWVDNNNQCAWGELAQQVEQENVDLVCLALSRSKFQDPTIRYGLSSFCLALQPTVGIILMGLDFDPENESSDSVPFLNRCRLMSFQDSSWVAKFTAQAYKKPKTSEKSYRIAMLGSAMFGQWYEVGPDHSQWQGAFFGIDNGEITHHAVGPKGVLPKTATLEFQSQGIKAEVAGSEFTAWAVKNKISEEDSYFIRVDGHPNKIIFGDEEGVMNGEVNILDMV